ncbi:MAG: winged helix-turn-helix domain-containing protein, partial [Candidatus Nanohaloarchaea archaeon]|nr:winged helix-turn-helix domain-containing protein [Candidatus Nanohaloarchaea archaeon]
SNGDTNNADMNLDFRSVQALASRSRIRILKELLREGKTPSELADMTDSDTSQIVMELETLSNADLVEQHTPDEGFNTIYRPTEKARKIVENGKSKVEFSVGSSVLTGFLGLAAVTSRFVNPGTSRQAAMMQEAGQPGTSGGATAAPVQEGILQQLADPVVVAGVLLLVGAILLIAYAWTVDSLSPSP